MQVDHVLILAAGKGTRMGNIGTILPKVIWPIFEKTILELEVLYAKEMAPKASIHINLYNNYEIIKEFIESKESSFDGVNLIIEKEPLDIGGAIHNLAKSLNYHGNLLVINSDQFLMFKENIVEKSISHLHDNDIVLYTYEVNQRDGYSFLNIENQYLKGIIKNEEVREGTFAQTYTGMSIINLDKLDKYPGKSSFFESIAKPNKTKIEFVEFRDFEYWDFGTLKRYHQSMYEVLKEKNSLFYKFLLNNKGIIEENNYESGYKSKDFINLDDARITSQKKSIVLDASEMIESNKVGIFYRNKFDEIN